MSYFHVFWFCKMFCEIIESVNCWGLRVPMIQEAVKWMYALNQDRFLVQSSLQKASGRGVRTHPPMVLSAMYIKRLSRSGSWSFTRYSKFIFFLVWRSPYIVSEARSSSLMREDFLACHDDSKVVAGPSSPCGRLSEILRGDLPSFLSFRSIGGGSWEVICHQPCHFALQAADSGLRQAVGMM